MTSWLAAIAADARLRQATSRPLLWLAILLPLAVFGGTAAFDYQTEVNRTRDQLSSTVDALAEHAQAVLQTSDLVLGRVLEHVSSEDWDTIRHSPGTHDYLVALRREIPELESIFLVTPDGRNIASSRDFPMPPISDAGREYFKAALAGNLRPFISNVFRSQVAGTYAFTVTRPMVKHDRFDGVAGVTLSPAYFETFYKKVLEHPATSAAALLREDGEVLARFPERVPRRSRLAEASPLRPLLAAGVSAGLVWGPSPADGQERMLAFKRLANWPLVVTFAADSGLYLQAWYFHLLIIGTSAFAIGLLLLLVERLIRRRGQQEQMALQALFAETTRRQQVEAALHESQKLEALGRLTGGVAHDFNNLLAAILGSLELLHKHVSGARPSRLLATARQAAERGAGLTAQMLAFSRRKEVLVRPFAVVAAVQGMDALLRQALGPEITLHFAPEPSQPLGMADKSQLEIALLNLAVNARDAMPRGGQLTISTAPVTVGREYRGVPAGAYVRVSVADTGDGMPEEVRTRAFEPFFTTKGPGKGTGLGLSMVFGFVTTIGGAVTIDSEPGCGTCISLYLPAAGPLDRTDSGHATTPPAVVHDGLRRFRVLLVDDDDAVRATAQVMLEDLVDQVVVAEQAQTALAILRTDRRFDLLIIDFAMPGMNGSDLAKAIRMFWPDAPLLFVTGYVENDALRPWRERGIPTLNKPFTQADLAAVIARSTEPVSG